MRISVFDARSGTKDVQLNGDGVPGAEFPAVRSSPNPRDPGNVTRSGVRRRSG
jgi:hypothetical protein